MHRLRSEETLFTLEIIMSSPIEVLLWLMMGVFVVLFGARLVRKVHDEHSDARGPLDESFERYRKENGRAA